MGWPMVMRIWLPAWLAAREDTVATVCERAEIASRLPRHVGERRVVTAYAAGAPPRDASQARQEADPAPQDADPASPVKPVRSSVASPESSEPGRRSRLATEPYAPFVPRQAGGLGVLDGVADQRPRATGMAQEVMRRIVAHEGPISTDRLLLLTARCFGMSRPPSWRLTDLARVLPVDLRRDPEEGFVWPEGRDPHLWTGFRTWEGTLKERPLEEIPLRELANAQADIARSAMGIELEELLRHTLKVFNGTRLTEAPRARLAAALQVAVERGLVRVDGGIVTAETG